MAIAVCYILSRYETHIGAKTQSPALVADGCESRMDMYSSVVVLISLLGALVGIKLNKIAGVIIALFIAKLGVELLIRSLKAFLGGLYADMEDAKDSGTPIEGASLISTVNVDTEKYIHRIRNMWKYAVLTIVILYVLSGIFVVESNEEGVVKRFGRETRAGIKPGLHYHLPYPFETVAKPKVTEVKRLELGFRYEKDPYTGGRESELWESSHDLGKYRKVPDESLMITGDENIVDVNMIVQYKIWDPSKYLFNNREPERVIKDVAEASLRQVVGSKKIDDALTGGKMEIQDAVKETIQSALNRYDTGLSVITIQLQDVHPPVEVAQAFKDVASAREDKNKKINDAEAYRNDVLPKARGDAEKMILEAQAYKAGRINAAKGETERFLSLYNEYTTHKNITRTRLYLEAMEQVLPKVKIYVVEPTDSGKSNLGLYSALIPLRDASTISGGGNTQASSTTDTGGFPMQTSEREYVTMDEEMLFERIDEKPTFL